ncbi:MAG TPA: GerMN domain-containing protein [Actinomycetales bacterium]|nr:GerMN domain-containing protein [Actinomycetales bacterium]
MSDDRTMPIPLGDEPDPEHAETARLLRRALTREADMVQPSERLSEITDRIESERRPRWVPALAAVAAVAAVAIGVGAVFALGGDDDPITPAQTPSVTDSATEPAPTTEPTPSETSEPPPPALGEALPVYWVGEQGSRFALFREFGEAGPADAAERVQAAVDAALGGTPADPDYSTPWANGSAATTSLGADEIGIDLNAAAAGSSMGSELAVVAVQQLVWTATAAAQQDVPVRFTVEGSPSDLFGVVSASEPISRGGGFDDPRALVWIDLPDGASTPLGALTVTGSGVNAYENTLVWTLERGGSVVDEGFFGVEGPGGAPVDTGQRGTWSLDLDVSAPGEYTLTVEVPDASGGAEGTVRSFDTKSFTVT